MPHQNPTAPTSRSRIPTRLVTVLVLTVLAVLFILQNNQMTPIRLLIPMVVMPLWVALASMLIVGVGIGYALNWRHR